MILQVLKPSTSPRTIQTVYVYTKFGKNTYKYRKRQWENNIQYEKGKKSFILFFDLSVGYCHI